jgi:GNAT superfamily N-acetyltransferase
LVVPVGTNTTLAGLSPLVWDLQPYYLSHYSAGYLQYAVDALVFGQGLGQYDVAVVGFAGHEADGVDDGRVVVEVVQLVPFVVGQGVGVNPDDKHQRFV